jgi:hypothetical protein
MFLLGRSLSPSFSVAAILSYSSILIMGEAALPLLLAHPILQNRFCTHSNRNWIAVFVYAVFTLSLLRQYSHYVLD